MLVGAFQCGKDARPFKHEAASLECVIVIFSGLFPSLIRRIIGGSDMPETHSRISKHDRRQPLVTDSAKKGWQSAAAQIYSSGSDHAPVILLQELLVTIPINPHKPNRLLEMPSTLVPSFRDLPEFLDLLLQL